MSTLVRYRPTLRPASRSTLPPLVTELGWDFVEAPWEGVNRPDLPRSQHRYGVIATPAILTKADRAHFDLEPVDLNELPETFR